MMSRQSSKQEKTPRESNVAPDEKRIFNRILVAVDGSENADRAARTATDLAQRYGSELIVLHVIPRPNYANIPVFPSVTPPTQTTYNEYYELAKRVAQGHVNRTVAQSQSRGVNVRAEIREAAPSTVQGITEYAQNEKTDLIVVGTRGLEGFRKLLIGSVSSGVITHAHCPVLVVR